MSDPQSELYIFNKISKEKIIELGDFFFDESILYKPLNLNKLEKILDINFEIGGVMKVASIFYNFL